MQKLGVVEMIGGSEIAGISCTVFRPEIEFLQRRGEITFPVSYVDSKLHMHPERLYEALRSRLDDVLQDDARVILFFGDCHIQMRRFPKNPRIVRLDGLNCGDIFLGRQRYKELMKQRAFLLFPEWAARWRTVFRELAQSCSRNSLLFFRDAQAKLVYLDTGTCPVPKAEIEACSAELGLPWELQPMTLEHFRGLIRNAVIRLRHKSTEARQAEEQ